MASKSFFWRVIFLILIIAGAVWIYNYAMSQENYGEFAKCLTGSGVKMYGAYWCSSCNNQKISFGKSWDEIDYVECSLPDRTGQTEACAEAGIRAYPTWEFADGKRIEGSLSLKTLSINSGCIMG